MFYRFIGILQSNGVPANRDKECFIGQPDDGIIKTFFMLNEF